MEIDYRAIYDEASEFDSDYLCDFYRGYGIDVRDNDLINHTGAAINVYLLLKLGELEGKL